MLNEEMSRETVSKVKNNSIKIAVILGKPSFKLFLKALAKSVGAGTHAVGEIVNPSKGKMKVKTLIRQGQGVSTVPISESGQKDFERIARKYGVDFSIVKDKNEIPPKYTIFFKAKDADAVTQILKDYSSGRMERTEEMARPSVLKKLEKLKEKVAAMPKKAVEKMKEAVL